MTGELSSMLDHIEKISELDLDDVAPTSHVVELENVLRPDEPRPSLPRERRSSRRRTPTAWASACPAPAHEHRPARSDRGRRPPSGCAAASCPPPSCSRPSASGPPRDALNAFLWVADGPPPELARRRPSGGRPAGGQGPVLHRGRAERGGLAHPRGLPAALHGHGRRAAGRRGRADARQDQHGRVRDGLVERELGLRPGARTRGTRPGCRAARAGARPRRWPPAWRRGRSAPTPAARSASRRRCAGSSGSSPPTARSRATG